MFFFNYYYSQYVDVYNSNETMFVLTDQLVVCCLFVFLTPPFGIGSVCKVPQKRHYQINWTEWSGSFGAIHNGNVKINILICYQTGLLGGNKAIITL